MGARRVIFLQMPDIRRFQRRGHSPAALLFPFASCPCNTIIATTVVPAIPLGSSGDAGMEFRTSVLLVALMAAPAVAHAEVCFSRDGFVMTCPSLLPHPVKARFEVGTLPRVAGSPSEIYITGGGRVDGTSNFYVFANGKMLCETSGNLDGSNTTPVRHCNGTITTPGTYVISASRSNSGNFLAPDDVVINVQ